MIEQLKPYMKATVSMVVCAAAYLTGVLPAEGSLADLSTAQWLGLIVFMGGAYGLTYTIPYRSTKPVDEAGSVEVVPAILFALLLVAVLWWFGVRP